MCHEFACVTQHLGHDRGDFALCFVEEMVFRSTAYGAAGEIYSNISIEHNSDGVVKSFFFGDKDKGFVVCVAREGELSVGIHLK